MSHKSRSRWVCPRRGGSWLEVASLPAVWEADRQKPNWASNFRFSSSNWQKNWEPHIRSQGILFIFLSLLTHDSSSFVFSERQPLHHSELAGAVLLLYMILNILEYIFCEQRRSRRHCKLNKSREFNISIHSIISCHPLRKTLRSWFCMFATVRVWWSPEMVSSSLPPCELQGSNSGHLVDLHRSIFPLLAIPTIPFTPMGLLPQSRCLRIKCIHLLGIFPYFPLRRFITYYCDGISIEVIILAI